VSVSGEYRDGMLAAVTAATAVIDLLLINACSHAKGNRKAQNKGSRSSETGESLHYIPPRRNGHTTHSYISYPIIAL
jgi:hypothetical protein